ncbi:MAG: FitA-like ribbon-helix-helix domain-containing protein [Waterburya sp.]
MKELLRIRAAHHGNSMEEQVRQILRHTLLQDTQLSENLAESIQKKEKSVVLFLKLRLRLLRLGSAYASLSLVAITLL